MNYSIALPGARLTLGFTLLICSLTLPGPAQAQSRNGTDAERELRAAEAQLASALSSVDVDQLSRLWADDFVSTMADGRVTTGKKRLEGLRAKKPDASSRVTNQNQQVDVRVQGDWALVLVTSSWVESGKPLGSPYQATHVWAKRDGRWRLLAAHISEVKP
jgi:ketosteroid isomerase-like protein